jgi:hypothetical protein
MTTVTPPEALDDAEAFAPPRPPIVRLTLLALLYISVAAAGAWLFTRPIYRAEARLFYDLPVVSGSMHQIEPPANPGAAATRLLSQQAIDQAIASPQWAATGDRRSATSFERRLTVRQAQRAVIVQFLDTDPAKATAAVQAMVHVADASPAGIALANRAIADAKVAHKDARATVQQIDLELRKVAEEYGSTDLQFLVRGKASQLAHIERTLTEEGPAAPAPLRDRAMELRVYAAYLRSELEMMRRAASAAAELQTRRTAAVREMLAAGVEVERRSSSQPPTVDLRPAVPGAPSIYHGRRNATWAAVAAAFSCLPLSVLATRLWRRRHAASVRQAFPVQALAPTATPA